MDAPLNQRVRDVLAAGRPLEDAIALLRNAGCSKGQSILMIADAAAMELAAATEAVNDSRTWHERKTEDASLNEALWATLEQEGDVQPDGSIDLTDWLNSGPEEEG